jgi:hypothetical protein
MKMGVQRWRDCTLRGLRASRLAAGLSVDRAKLNAASRVNPHLASRELPVAASREEPTAAIERRCRSIHALASAGHLQVGRPGEERSVRSLDRCRIFLEGCLP